MAKINIDGRDFVGRSISIINGKVKVDGVEQDGSLHGVVEIRILEGKLEQLTTDASVNCGDVLGSVEAGGSVNCGNVGSSVDAGGSVNCGKVSGSVDAGGSVRMG